MYIKLAEDLPSNHTSRRAGRRSPLHLGLHGWPQSPCGGNTQSLRCLCRARGGPLRQHLNPSATGVDLGEAWGAAGALCHWLERRPPGAISVGRRCGAPRRVMAAAAVPVETSVRLHIRLRRSLGMDSSTTSASSGTTANGFNRKGWGSRRGEIEIETEEGCQTPRGETCGEVRSQRAVRDGHT
jgi:hypothetical protein